MLVDSTTYRTPLTGVFRIHLDDLLAGKDGFVRQLLLQVVVRPANIDISVFRPYALGRSADARKVFKHEQRSCGIGIGECLGNAVIHITHPSVLSLADHLEAMTGRWCSSLLEFAPKYKELCMSCFNTASLDESRLLSVICHDRLADAAVNANDFDGLVRNVDSLGYRDMQEATSLVVNDKFRCPETCLRIRKVILPEELESESDAKGIYGKHTLRIGPVPPSHEVTLRSAETDTRPFMAVTTDCSVLGDDGLENGLRHLGFQLILRTQALIQGFIQRIDLLIACVKDIIRNKVAGITIGRSRLCEHIPIGIARHQTYFKRCRDFLFHTIKVTKVFSVKQKKAGRNSSQKLKISGFPCDKHYEFNPSA